MKPIIILLILALYSCKKDTSDTAHLFPTGAVVVLKNFHIDGSTPPFTVTGVYWVAEKRDPNYYTIKDANGKVFFPIADYSLKSL